MNLLTVQYQPVKLPEEFLSLSILDSFSVAKHESREGKCTVWGPQAHLGLEPQPYSVVHDLNPFVQGWALGPLSPWALASCHYA